MTFNRKQAVLSKIDVCTIYISIICMKIGVFIRGPGLQVLLIVYTKVIWHFCAL